MQRCYERRSKKDQCIKLLSQRLMQSPLFNLESYFTLPERPVRNAHGNNSHPCVHKDRLMRSLIWGTVAASATHRLMAAKGNLVPMSSLPHHALPLCLLLTMVRPESRLVGGAYRMARSPPREGAMSCLLTFILLACLPLHPFFFKTKHSYYMCVWLHVTSADHLLRWVSFLPTSCGSGSRTQVTRFAGQKLIC